VSGRLHSRAIVIDDLRRLRAVGISNLNLDLIAGLAGQTAASWDESLSVLIDTGVPHASIYMLEVDEDSRLGREMISGGSRYFSALVPTDDAIADMYSHSLARLAQAGLRQYEISNFARRHRQSQHNLRYWQRRPYLGLGLDASSMLYALTEDSDTTQPVSYTHLDVYKRQADSRRVRQKIARKRLLGKRMRCPRFQPKRKSKLTDRCRETC